MVERSPIRPSAQRGVPSSDELKRAVQSLLDDFSIETTPHAPEEADSLPEFLQPGTRVYVAHPQNSTLEDVIHLALRLKQLGFEPVPHLIARKLEDREQLADAATRLGDAGIGQGLVVAGDLSRPKGPYDCAMQVLESGLLQEHGILSVGIAGHPEGSRVIGTSVLRRALLDKARLAEETGLRMHIVSQFGFDPQAVVDWEASIRADGVDLPIHVGMAGKAPLKQVLRYAIRCGIASSMRMLVSKANSFANRSILTPVDQLLVAFSRHRLSHPECRMQRAHFFAFGGAERTSRWISALRSGEFDIDEKGTGLRLHSRIE